MFLTLVLSVESHRQNFSSQSIDLPLQYECIYQVVCVAGCFLSGNRVRLPT